MNTTSQNAGMYAPPAADGPNRQQICGTSSRQRHLVGEDPAGAAASGEEVDLVGDPRTRGVDEPEDRQLGASARSVTRTIFSTVRAPHEPAFTRPVVGDDERRTPLDEPLSGDHSVGGQALGKGVGQCAVLDERALVEQQSDPLARRQVARGSVMTPLRSPRLRAITMRCTSDVPSPISRIFASR